MEARKRNELEMMIEEAHEIEATEIEATDAELEVEALMEVLGVMIDEFGELSQTKDKRDERLSISKEIDKRIERFVELTKDAGNEKMGKAVKKRWMKIKKSPKIKE